MKHKLMQMFEVSVDLAHRKHSHGAADFTSPADAAPLPPGAPLPRPPFGGVHATLGGVPATFDAAGAMANDMLFAPADTALQLSRL